MNMISAEFSFKTKSVESVDADIFIITFNSCKCTNGNRHGNREF